jgi:ACS family hexuronate transporter-like MFS transporter
VANVNEVEPAGPETAAAAAEPHPGLDDEPGGRMTRYRWVICALLFFATTVNYLDRMVLGILAPRLQQEVGWNEAEYGYINAAFTFSYAIGLLVVGGLMDRWGARKGFGIAVVVWSVAAMGHALARSWQGFAIARASLAFAEAGNFPGAVKTVAEWFPKRERALATGLFNAGSNVGALIAPLVVPFIALHFGWRWAFVATGATGFIWLVFWLGMYRRPEEHPRVSAGELALIRSDPAEPETKIPWVRLFPHRQTWAFAVGKALTDPVWWFFLFWLPKYLSSTYGLNLTGLALPLVIIYLAADVGSIGGGWLSSALIRMGWSVNAARKTAMFVCGACVVPMVLATYIEQLWVTVALISLAAAAHQGWSANLYTLVSDTFPRRAVGSVVGIGGMAGALAGAVASYGIGQVLHLTGGNYVPLLTIAGTAYLVTLLIIHLLVPRLAPADVT